MAAEPARIDPRVCRTRQMLFQAFRSLLAEKSFDSIKVLDIAQRSTLNRATFYDHFPDKFALLEAMIRERISALIATRIEQSSAGCEAALRQLILAACDFLVEISSGCQKHQRQFEPLVESQMKAVMYETLLPTLRHHRLKNPELRATMLTWAIAGAALHWSRQRKTSADAFANEVLPMAVANIRE